MTSFYICNDSEYFFLAIFLLSIETCMTPDRQRALGVFNIHMAIDNFVLQFTHKIIVLFAT